MLAAKGAVAPLILGRLWRLCLLAKGGVYLFFDMLNRVKVFFPGSLS